MVLTCEENFHQYFANNDGLSEETKARNDRYCVPGGESRRK